MMLAERLVVVGEKYTVCLGTMKVQNTFTARNLESLIIQDLIPKESNHGPFIL